MINVKTILYCYLAEMQYDKLINMIQRKIMFLLYTVKVRVNIFTLVASPGNYFIFIFHLYLSSKMSVFDLNLVFNANESKKY